MIQILGAMRINIIKVVTNLALCCSTPRQESLNLRSVLIKIVIIDVFDSVDVEDWRLVEIVSK